MLRFGFGLVPALLTVLAAGFVARVLRRRFRRAAQRLDQRGRIRIAPNTLTLFDNLVTIVVFFLAGIVILGIFGISSGSLVTFLGLVTAAVTLSLQDVLRNLVAGVFLLVEQPFAIGDRIRVSGEEGVVERVGIRTTVLRNARAEPVLVPNNVIFTQAVTNRSGREPDRSRTDTLVFTLTGVDLPPEEALTALRETLRGVSGLAGVTPDLDVDGAGAAGIDLRVNLPLLHASAVSAGAVIAALRERFPEATIVRVREA